jgi:hypothetical protein
MAARKKLLFLLLLPTLLAVSACSEKLPENFGIYANSDKGQIRLEGQKAQFSGNLLESISGVKGPSGAAFNSVKDLIVFEKDLDPKIVKLSNLKFLSKGEVKNLFGTDTVDINLWTISGDIPVDISPVSKKKDMYKITPKTKLGKGFYAIHFGSLESRNTLDNVQGNRVFDFVIGDVKDYPSFEESQRANREAFMTQANSILKTINDCFNGGSFEKMRSVYQPDGEKLDDAKWKEFCSGQLLWKKQSGNILKSVIVSSDVGDDTGTFDIETTYEKKGIVKERIAIKRKDNSFVIIKIE